MVIIASVSPWWAVTFNELLDSRARRNRGIRDNALEFLVEIPICDNMNVNMANGLLQAIVDHASEAPQPCKRLIVPDRRTQMFLKSNEGVSTACRAITTRLLEMFPDAHVSLFLQDEDDSDEVQLVVDVASSLSGRDGRKLLYEFVETQVAELVGDHLKLFTFSFSMRAAA